MNFMPADDDRIGTLLQESASTFRTPEGLKAAVRDELTATPPRRRHRRMITAALATVSGLAALLAVVLWPTSITMAEVYAALDEAPWVHIRYDTGKEVWISVPRNVYATKHATGGHVYVDYGQGRRWWWHVHTFRAGVEPRRDTQIVKDDVEAHFLGATIWEQVVGHLERQAEQPNPRRDDWTVEVHEETVDGRRLVRFDSYHTDGVGRRLLLKQLWADPETWLPVKTREKLQLADREVLGVEHANGVFEFPEKGPESIYDLGAPRDLPIVRRDEGGPTPEAALILDAARAARDRFPEHFSQLCWGVERWRGDEVDVLHFSGRPNWRDGGRSDPRPWYDTVRVRCERYFQLDDPMTFPATADEVETWLERQSAVTLDVSDGKRTFSRQGPFANMPLEARVLEMQRRTLLNKSNWIPELQWPLYESTSMALDIIDGSNELPDGVIGLRHELGDRRSDFYIDPRLDFICIRRINWRLIDGEWRIELEIALGDFVQLPGGQWAATTRSTGERGVFRNYAITVLEEGDLPPALFDVETLIEEARRDGAIIETH